MGSDVAGSNGVQLDDPDSTHNKEQLSRVLADMEEESLTRRITGLLTSFGRHGRRIT